MVMPVPAKKGTTEKAKPGSSTEVVVLLVEGSDTGPKAETSYIKFKDALSTNPYFKDRLSKEKGWRFKGIPEEAVLPGGKPVVQFKLEGFYPEKVRSNE